MRNFRQKLLVAEILLPTREKLGMKEMEGVTDWDWSDLFSGIGFSILFEGYN